MDGLGGLISLLPLEMRRYGFIFILLLIALGGGFYLFGRRDPPLETKFVQPGTPLRQGYEGQVEEKPFDAAQGNKEKVAVTLRQPGEYFLLDSSRQVYQTFNNCGPATLSMNLSWYGIDVSQKELGEKMRPYQNPKGDNDDKTIFTHEFATWAENYGLNAISRVNGSIELLKLFVVNDIPVVVKTWLRPNEDIGHFRIVRGFDEGKQVIIQDDSYHGPNKKISYYDFLSMWQPFNYAYIVVYPAEKEALVFAILGEERDEAVAWDRALERAKKEADLDPENIYPLFNQSASYYQLGEYEESVATFEQVEDRLPRRMLWYQIEPILAYQKLGRFDRVFAIADTLLNGGNRAFSELYQIRGEVFLEQGDREKAREQFELALAYNEHFEPAKVAIAGLTE